MLIYFFQLLSSFDGWIAPYLSGLVRACLYGALSGVGALILYAVVSNQSRIKGLKSEARRLRKQMLDATLSYREMMQLSKKNLMVSLRLLGHALWPCLLSSLPPILFMAWMSIYQSYTLPTNGMPISVTFVPKTAPVVIEPSGISTEFGNGKRVIAVEPGQSMWFGIDGKTVYEGIITNPPVETVHKKRWWNAVMADAAGYIRSDAPVDKIVFDFPRKRFIEGGPAWLATWELPFFLLLFISGIVTKLVFKIE
jgi:hypothetical protein